MLRNPFGRTPTELLDDMCHIESRFGLFGDRVSFGARCTQFAPNASKDRKPFWMHPMILLGKGAQVEAQFALFGDSANLDAR